MVIQPVAKAGPLRQSIYSTPTHFPLSLTVPESYCKKKWVSIEEMERTEPY